MTVERKDVAGIIKAFDNDTRKAIDEALALGNDFARAHNDEAKRMNVARAIAIYHIAADEKAVEKTGCKTFKDVAAKLFFMKPELATNYRKAAEQFYCKDGAPACKDWWGPTTLYLFCAAKVDNDTIAAAIEAGKLSDKSTNEQIKAWIASLQSEALEDGKVEVAKLYDGVITRWTMQGATDAAFYAVTLDELKADMSEGGPADDSYFSAFDPHSTVTRINRRGAAKDVKGKGIMLHTLNGPVTAIYYPAEVKKSNGPTEKTVQAQNDTIARMRAAMVAAGLDPDAI